MAVTYNQGLTTVLPLLVGLRPEIMTLNDEVTGCDYLIEERIDAVSMKREKAFSELWQVNTQNSHKHHAGVLVTDLRSVNETVNESGYVYGQKIMGYGCGCVHTAFEET